MKNLAAEVNKVKVLVVDDMEENLELLRGILRGKEFEVSFAKNGKDALEKAQRKRHDIILLDVYMPEMDGYEVCRNLKMNEITRDIPVIFLTAKTDVESIIKGFEIGGEDYITKPFSIEELLARIRVHAELVAAKRNIAKQNIQLMEYNEILNSILNLSEVLFEKDIDAKFWIDEDGEIIKCNSAAAALLESKKLDLIGVNQEKIYSKEVKESLDYKLNKKKGILETEIVTNTGKRKDVRIHTTTIEYNNKLIQQMTFVDITREKIDALKILEQNTQLQELNLTKDKFLSIIAHDLRGPIGMGREMLKLIIEEIEKIPEKEEELFEIISEMEKYMKNIYNLLDNLLNWAMVQKGEISFLPEDADVAVLMSSAVLVLEPLAENKRIKINNKSISVPLFVDKQMMITVFRNLISNAIKFNEEGGEINIKTIKKSGQCEIKIKDSGVGMSRDKISKLFKINEKVTTLGTRDEKGTGLGLILCKEFVEKNGGEIKIRSKLGEWTEFKINLPYKMKK